jgi:hypothetical protein
MIPMSAEGLRPVKGEATTLMRARDFCSWILLLTLGVGCAAAQGDSTITPNGIGGLRLCQALSSVRGLFPAARDTVISSEEAQWPAKVVPLARGKRILFESSWIDTTHVWRISTNSPGYKTARGYHVGMSLGDLRDRGEKLHFDYEEGYIVVTLSSEQIAFTPDDSTAKAFLNRSPTAFDSLESLPHSARIKEFIVSGDCHR